MPTVRRMRRDSAEAPFIVIWEVTRACQLACVHCRAEAIKHRDPLELSTAEGQLLLDQIAGFGRPLPLVVLTGGDPLERPDLTDLVAYGTGLGLSMAASPSVTPRLTEGALAELRDAGTKAVSISLDGASAASHDGFRKVEGVFEATVEAMASVRELGMRLQVNTTVTADNVTELPDILRMVLDAGAQLWSVFFLVPTGRGATLAPLTPGEEEQLLHWLYDISTIVAVKTTEAPQYRRVVLQRSDPSFTPPGGDLYRRLSAESEGIVADRTRRRARRPPIDVNSANGFVFVDHRGTVHPSGFLPEPAGNIRTQLLAEIYRGSPLFTSLRDPDRLGGKCGRCEYRDICGGSRSRAYAATGDPLAADPSCTYQPTAIT